MPLAFEIFFAFGFASLLQSSVKQLEAEMHARDVIAKADRIHVGMSESTVFVGMKFQNRNPVLDEQFRGLWKRVGKNWQALNEMPGNKQYRRLVGRVKEQLNGFKQFQNFFWQSPPDPTAEDNPFIQEQIHSQMLSFYLNRDERSKETPLGQLIEYELRSVEQGPELHKRIAYEFSMFIFFGVFADIVLLTFLSIYFWKSIKNRIDSLMETTNRLSRGEDLLPPMRGDDELAMLDLLLHDTASRIIETQKFKRQLLGVVCHELKAPLSAIQILISLMNNAAAQFSESANSAIQRASKGCNRLQIMVGELLDLETMNSQKVKLSPRSVNILDLLNTAVETVSAIANDYDVQLLVKNEVSEATLDPDRMLQVLVNLLSNAIKFSPQRSQVILSAKQTEQFLELSVQDFGPGIPQDLQPKLFDLFSQGKQQPEKKKIKGTGLGLSISKAIVNAHGGDIDVNSRPNEGSTFTVKVPRQTVDQRLPANGNPQEKIVLAERAKPKFAIKHKGIILIGLPLATQILLVGSLCYLLQQAKQELDRQSVSRTVVSQSQKLVQEMSNTAILLFFCGEPKNKDDLYKEQFENNKKALSVLQNTCSDDSQRKEIYKQIDADVKKLDELHKTVVREGRKRKLTAENSTELVNSYLETWSSFAAEVDRLATKEESIENQEGKSLQATTSRLDTLLLSGIFANISSALLLAYFLARDINKRIQRVQENASRILKKEELLQPVSGSDEIAELDKAFHDAANSLHEEQEMKQRLLAIASHELRAPLSSIGMSIGLFTQGVYGEISPEQTKIVKQIESACQRLVALINDILDIEKMEAGKFELSIEEVQARKVVARAIACVQPIAEKCKIRLENKVEDITLYADPERLIQVLINLITNAIKFSQEDQAVLISSTKLPNEELRIQIEDSGAGISKEIQERIFEQFVKSNSKENAEGTGLGLPIAKAIVEQHGGKIGCESSEGKGATFWFSLPLPAEKTKSSAAIQAG